MSIKFTVHEANLIKVAFREYEKQYGRFTPEERKDLVNVKEALMYVHDIGRLNGEQHKMHGEVCKKLEGLAGKKLETEAEKLKAEEEAKRLKILAEKQRIKEEAERKVAEQEAKVKAEQEKLLAEKKAAHQAEKVNVVTGEEKEEIDNS